MTASIDFETRSLVDIKLGAWRYAEDPSTEILCMAYQLPGMKSPGLWWPHEPFPLDLLAHVRARKPVRAFNAEFELAIWTRKLEHALGVPLRLDQLHCTQSEAQAMALPQSLEECGEALGVAQKHLKDPAGKKLIQYLCRPFKGAFREDHERLLALGEYCKQDITAELAVARKVHRLSTIELNTWRLTLDMNRKGLPVDLVRVRKMAARVSKLQHAGVAECVKLTGGIKPSQREQLLEWLNDRGCDLPNMQKQTLERAVAAEDDPYGGAHRVMELRLLVNQTSLAKLKKLPLAVCADGVMRGLFKYHAASTGRYASQGGFNAQNLPRGTFETLEEYLKVLRDIDSATLGDMVSVLRAVFSFPITSVDYSQIETRVILWMAGDEFGLDEFREGLDPYKTMATRIYRVGYDDVVKWQRQIGKSAVLGAGYQLGWKGYIAYCDKQDIVVTEEQARHVIETFRSKYSRVTIAWKNFQEAAVRAIRKPGTPYFTNKCRLQVREGYLWMQLPSGSEIAYKDPVLKPGREDWMGPEITYMGRDRYTRKWVRQSTYGGSIFQSAVQGTARDLMTDAMLRAHRAGIDLRGTVHDEVIAFGACSEKLAGIMCTLPEWARGLPVKADGWEGEFYRK